MKTKQVNKLCAIAVAREPEAYLLAVAARMQRRGCVVEFVAPHMLQHPMLHHLIILRAKSQDATSWARYQQSLGKKVAPDPLSIDRVKDRWVCRELLLQAGTLLPEAFVGRVSEALLSGVVEKMLPVIIKRRRLHGSPVFIAHTRNELSNQLGAFDARAEIVIERYIEGGHFTAFFLGEKKYVFRRAPLASDSEGLEPVKSPAEGIFDSVNLYRRATGLRFGKVDIVVSQLGDVYLVDGGVFPNLTHIPEAETFLAEHFLSFFGLLGGAYAVLQTGQQSI
jgi:hypothetical protein